MADGADNPAKSTASSESVQQPMNQFLLTFLKNELNRNDVIERVGDHRTRWSGRQRAALSAGGRKGNGRL